MPPAQVHLAGGPLDTYGRRHHAMHVNEVYLADICIDCGMIRNASLAKVQGWHFDQKIYITVDILLIHRTNSSSKQPGQLFSRLNPLVVH